MNCSMNSAAGYQYWVHSGHSIKVIVTVISILTSPKLVKYLCPNPFLHTYKQKAYLIGCIYEPNGSQLLTESKPNSSLFKNPQDLVSSFPLTTLLNEYHSPSQLDFFQSSYIPCILYFKVQLKFCFFCYETCYLPGQIFYPQRILLVLLSQGTQILSGIQLFVQNLPAY